MYEMRLGFEDHAAFIKWRSSIASDARRIVDDMVAKVERDGIIEPISGRRFTDVPVDRRRLHLSIDGGVLNCRKRVGLLAVEMAVESLRNEVRRRPKILGAEAVTYVASILRGGYPYYLGTEYLPTEEERSAEFPIPHLDLMDINLAAESFDVFFSAHVLEHVPSVETAIREVARILKPGGILVSTYPFRHDRVLTETKARLSKSGQIEHLMEPEYHGNPVRKEEGSLVFQLPGWDILEMCRRHGLTNAKLVLMASAKHGVVCEGTVGLFTLFARKPYQGELSSPKLPAEFLS